MSTTAPAKKARGRPRKDPGDVASEMIHYRATKAEVEKYAALGGSKWLRAAINRARVTRATEPPP